LAWRIGDGSGLGRKSLLAREIDELRGKVDAAGMPEPVKKEALRELDGGPAREDATTDPLDLPQSRDPGLRT